MDLAITGQPVGSLANKQVRGFYQRGKGQGWGWSGGGGVYGEGGRCGKRLISALKEAEIGGSP